jgi:hypothetical protein
LQLSKKNQTAGGETMTAFTWTTNLIDAKDAARAEGKPILLDCFNPQ